MPNDPTPTSPIRDPQVKAVLARLQAGRKRHASGGPLGNSNASRDPFQYAEYGFSIVPEQSDLIYLLCRGLRTQRVAEFATSIGMSTIYFAAAVRDNGGGKVIGSELVPAKVPRHVIISPTRVWPSMPRNSRGRCSANFCKIWEAGGLRPHRWMAGQLGAITSAAGDRDHRPARIRIGGYVMNDNGEPDFLDFIQEPVGRVSLRNSAAQGWDRVMR